MGLGVSWYRCPVAPLGFLPCASAAPPSAASPSGFCALDGCVSMPDSSLLVYSWGWVGGFFAAPLGFFPCAVLFLRACCVRCFPCYRFPWGFQVTGCLSFCFPGDVGWASALPFFFYASPAPLACRGGRGYAPCVRVLPLRWCLLGLKVWSPCCPSLTFGWVCFWPAVSQAFVVRHSLRFVDAYSGRWMVQVPDVFFASVSLIDPVALSPLLHRVFADGFRHWCAFRLCGGASPHAFGSVGALGELRWLHLYRLTPDLVGLRRFTVWLWSSGRCFLFSCATFRTSPWRSFCQFP